MRQLQLFPDKTTFEPGDRIQLTQIDDCVPREIGAKGTVLMNPSEWLQEFVFVEFDNRNPSTNSILAGLPGYYNYSFYCYPEKIMVI